MKKVCDDMVDPLHFQPHTRSSSVGHAHAPAVRASVFVVQRAGAGQLDQHVHSYNHPAAL